MPHQLRECVRVQDETDGLSDRQVADLLHLLDSGLATKEDILAACRENEYSCGETFMAAVEGVGKVQIDLSNFRVSPRNLQLKLGDTLEFRSANASVIKPYIEVLELKTNQVVFTADTLRQDTTALFVAQRPGRFVYRSEIFPFVKGVVEVMEKASTEVFTAKNEEPSMQQACASSSLEKSGNIALQANAGVQQEEAKLHEQEQAKQEEQEQELTQHHQQEQAKQEQPLQRLPTPPLPVQQEFDRRRSSSSAFGSTLHERKQHRVSISEQVDEQESRRESTSSALNLGGRRSRRVSFSEHAMLADADGMRESLEEGEYSKPQSQGGTAQASGMTSRRSSGSRGHTDGEDGSMSSMGASSWGRRSSGGTQCGMMDQEAAMAATSAAMAAAAAMPQLTKVALEHKQQRMSSGGPGSPGPSPHVSDSSYASYTPRNKEAADLSSLTSIALAAANSAICSPRTRSSRQASRGGSSTGSMSEAASPAPARHVKPSDLHLRALSKLRAGFEHDNHTSGSETEDGSSSHRLTRRTTYHGGLRPPSPLADFQRVRRRPSTRRSQLSCRSAPEMDSHDIEPDAEDSDGDAPSSMHPEASHAGTGTSLPCKKLATTDDLLASSPRVKTGAPSKWLDTSGQTSPSHSYKSLAPAQKQFLACNRQSPARASPAAPNISALPLPPPPRVSPHPHPHAAHALTDSAAGAMYGAFNRAAAAGSPFPAQASPSAWGREVTAAAQQQQQQSHLMPYQQPQHMHQQHLHPSAAPHATLSLAASGGVHMSGAGSGHSSRFDSPLPPPPPQIPQRSTGSGVFIPQVSAFASSPRVSGGSSRYSPSPTKMRGTGRQSLSSTAYHSMASSHGCSGSGAGESPSLPQALVSGEVQDKIARCSDRARAHTPAGADSVELCGASSSASHSLQEDTAMFSLSASQAASTASQASSAFNSSSNFSASGMSQRHPGWDSSRSAPHATNSAFKPHPASSPYHQSLDVPGRRNSSSPPLSEPQYTGDGISRRMSAVPTQHHQQPPAPLHPSFRPQQLQLHGGNPAAVDGRRSSVASTQPLYGAPPQAYDSLSRRSSVAQSSTPGSPHTSGSRPSNFSRAGSAMSSGPGTSRVAVAGSAMGGSGPLLLPSVASGGSQDTLPTLRTLQPSARPTAITRTPCHGCNKLYIAALNAKRCAAQHEGVSRVLAKGVPFTDAWAERCKEYGWAELKAWWQAKPVVHTREVFGLLAAISSGVHTAGQEPSPDVVLSVVQNYWDTHVSIAASTTSAYGRAGLALMQWLDTRASGHPPVTFNELQRALEQASEGTAFGLPYGVERGVSLDGKPLSPLSCLRSPFCGEACLAYLIELRAGQLIDDCRQKQRTVLEESLTEDAWSGQALDLLLSFDLYKGNTRHVESLFKMMQAPESFLDGKPAELGELQAVGCLVPAPLRLRWEQMVSNKMLQLQHQAQANTTAQPPLQQPQPQPQQQQQKSMPQQQHPGSGTSHTPGFAASALSKPTHTFATPQPRTTPSHMHTPAATASGALQSAAWPAKPGASAAGAHTGAAAPAPGTWTQASVAAAPAGASVMRDSSPAPASSNIGGVTGGACTQAGDAAGGSSQDAKPVPAPSQPQQQQMERKQQAPSSSKQASEQPRQQPQPHSSTNHPQPHSSTNQASQSQLSQPPTSALSKPPQASSTQASNNSANSTSNNHASTSTSNNQAADRNASSLNPTTKGLIKPLVPSLLQPRGSPAQLVQQARLQQAPSAALLRCPVCATDHTNGINVARCEVRHRGCAGSVYLTTGGRRFIPGWRGATSALGGRGVAPIKEDAQQRAKEDMRSQQLRLKDSLAALWAQLVADNPHAALRLQGLVHLTGALPQTEELSPPTAKWAAKWAKMLGWAQQVLAPEKATGAAGGAGTLISHITQARAALGIQKHGSKAGSEACSMVEARASVADFDSLWSALQKANGDLSLTAAQFRAEDMYASIHLDSAAGSQVMRGVKGELGAAETACSVLAVMLELELRGALEAQCAHAPKPPQPKAESSAEQQKAHKHQDRHHLDASASAQKPGAGGNNQAAQSNPSQAEPTAQQRPVQQQQQQPAGGPVAKAGAVSRVQAEEANEEWSMPSPVKKALNFMSNPTASLQQQPHQQQQHSSMRHKQSYHQQHQHQQHQQQQGGATAQPPRLPQWHQQPPMHGAPMHAMPQPPMPYVPHPMQAPHMMQQPMYPPMGPPQPHMMAPHMSPVAPMGPMGVPPPSPMYPALLTTPMHPAGMPYYPGSMPPPVPPHAYYPMPLAPSTPLGPPLVPLQVPVMPGMPVQHAPPAAAAPMMAPAAAGPPPYMPSSRAGAGPVQGAAQPSAPYAPQPWGKRHSGTVASPGSNAPGGHGRHGSSGSGANSPGAAGPNPGATGPGAPYTRQSQGSGYAGPPHQASHRTSYQGGGYDAKSPGAGPGPSASGVLSEGQQHSGSRPLSRVPSGSNLQRQAAGAPSGGSVLDRVPTSQQQPPQQQQQPSQTQHLPPQPQPQSQLPQPQQPPQPQQESPQPEAPHRQPSEPSVVLPESSFIAEGSIMASDLPGEARPELPTVAAQQQQGPVALMQLFARSAQPQPQQLEQVQEQQQPQGKDGFQTEKATDELSRRWQEVLEQMGGSSGEDEATAGAAAGSQAPSSSQGPAVQAKPWPEVKHVKAGSSASSWQEAGGGGNHIGAPHPSQLPQQHQHPQQHAQQQQQQQQQQQHRPRGHQQQQWPPRQQQQQQQHPRPGGGQASSYRPSHPHKQPHVPAGGFSQQQQQQRPSVAQQLQLHAQWQQQQLQRAPPAAVNLPPHFSAGSAGGHGAGGYPHRQRGGSGPGGHLEGRGRGRGGRGGRGAQ